MLVFWLRIGDRALLPVGPLGSNALGDLPFLEMTMRYLIVFWCDERWFISTANPSIGFADINEAHQVFHSSVGDRARNYRVVEAEDFHHKRIPPYVKD